MSGYVARGKMIIACRILVRKSEGERPLKRPRHTWENAIKVGLGCEGVD
jgi:hypothetical protein